MKSLDPDKIFIVNFAPIFAGLNPPDKELIMQKSKVVEYRKGDIIYKQFDPPDAFYCVITGRVRIFNLSATKKNILEYLNCGKYFGIISLLTQDAHSVNAEAANDSKVLRIDKEDFQVVLNKIPRVAIDLSKTLSRRLRKKDAQEKIIFESNIICVFSQATGVGRRTYAINLALSLSKETGKNVILINVSEQANHAWQDSVIKSAIIQEPDAKINILNIGYNSTDTSYTSNFNAFLTSLTSDYHYIIVNLPPLAQAAVLQILDQSDIIHIITDYNANNIEKTKVLISDLFQRVKYPQEKIKVIMNTPKDGKCLTQEEASKRLDYKIYAALPMCLENVSRIALEGPHTEYAKVIRRIAREVGDVRVGLALSGGAAFGLAHIGVIKVLEKENIHFDVVVGSSIGALVGALWAAGLNSSEIERIAMELNNNKKRVFRLFIDPCFPKLSFTSGRSIRSLLERHIGHKTFKDIKFPFKVVACNLSKRKEVIFDSGSLVDAVMASIAIPGVFVPTKINNDLILDGGVIEPVPIGTLVKMGIKKIIAVNVLPSPENIAQSYEFNLKRSLEEKRQAQLKGFFAKLIHSSRIHFKRIFSPNILDVIVNSIQTMEYVIAENYCQIADVVLRPVATGVDWFEFFKAETLIKKGEEEASELLAAINNVISE